MEKNYIATGKTIDLAIQAALTQLKLDRDSVSVEVLENAKSGFLGIGASPAKVKVTYEVPDVVETPAAALSSASRSKPKKKEKPADAKVVDLPKAAPRPEQPVRAEQPARTEQSRAERPSRPAPRQQSGERRGEPRRDGGRRKPQSRGPRPERADRPERTERPAAPKPVREYAPAAPGSTEERIEQFIKGLLEHMGSNAVPHAERTAEDTYSVELVGENLGMLIGRRGDTLDAIQHLTNYAINRDADKRSRINVDAESYRAKREESLQRLAHKVAGKVARYRRNITLEPMNAYERHVIHAALQDTPDITTFSTGTEPNRRVVVSYSRYKNQAPAREEAES